MVALEVSNDVLKKAVELRMSDVFPSMNVANAIGGTQTDAWRLCRQESLAELIAESLDRGLPVSEFRCEVTDKKFMDCRSYLRVREEIGGRPDFPV